MQNFNILHQFEQLFSLFQCVKILDYMGLSYGEIISKEAKDKNKCLRKYREDSNIFAYYILKSIWFFNSDIFLSWFDNHNTFLIYSQKTSNYLKNLLAMTKKYYNKDILYSKTRQTTHPHQLHLEFLSETGIFGSIFLAFMIISSIIAGIKNYIKSRNLYCLSSLLFFCASTLAILPAGSFFTTYGAAIFWINYGIFMAKNK